MSPQDRPLQPKPPPFPPPLAGEGRVGEVRPLDKVTEVGNSRLRRGWTTGTCATAAAKAAYTALLTGEFPHPVEVPLPRGERGSFALPVARKDAGPATPASAHNPGAAPSLPTH